MVVLISACLQSAPELQLFAPSRLVDDGRTVDVTVTVEGQAGVVSVEATAGTFVDDALRLQNGSAVFRYTCARTEDARCAGRVVITARFRNLAATRSLEVVPPGTTAGGGPGDDTAGGRAGGGFIAMGGGVSGAGGGSARAGGNAAGGTATAGGSSGGSALPIDAGPPPFDCLDYDGGVHPGFTFDDGGALSVGCDGEPIDAVFLTTTSPQKVSVCGTVRLSEPAATPVFPRSVFIGTLRSSGIIGLNCCSTLRCLRDPNEVRYRFELESGAFHLGVGARSDDYSYSQFGYYAGTQASPITDPDAGAWLVVSGLADGGASLMRNVDFFVGRGKRPGDP